MFWAGVSIVTKNPQLCPGLNASEIQIPHDKRHKESSLVKSHQNTHTNLSDMK